MDMNMDDFIKDFLEEAFEKIEIIDDNLLNLENEPDNEEFLNEIFRSAHTVKGSAGTMGFENVAELMHNIENIFSMLKENKLQFTPDINDVVFEGMDKIKEMLEHIESKGKEEGEATVEIKKLQQISNPSADNSEAEKGKKETKSNLSISDIDKDVLKQEVSNGKKIYSLTVIFSKDSLMPSVGRFLVIREIENSAHIIKASPTIDELNEDKLIPSGDFIISTNEKIAVIKQKLNIPNEVDDVKFAEYNIEQEETESKAAEKEKQPKKDGQVANNKKNQPVKKTKPSLKKDTVQSLRVDSVKIDSLLNLIGEQVINTSKYFRLENKIDSRFHSLKIAANNLRGNTEESLNELMNMVNDLYAEFKDITDTFRETNIMTRRLNNEMQQNTMKIRMLPVEKVFKRFPRMVRDISRELKKDIELEITGQETELDKTVIEILGDPLVHIVRNALDHGIETREERKENNKPVKGNIHLNARHEGNSIFIEITDDGKGLPRDKILQKAIDKGIIVDGMDKNLSDKEIYGLIFEPGFSTADQVSDLSGRGVGMDVVKKSIDKVNGSVEVESNPGRGTTVRIKLPLTMAIIEALLVKGLNQTFSIPLNAVEETVKIPRKDIYSVGNSQTINIRGNVISVISIEKLFNKEEVEREENFIVILGYGDRQIGLIVDKLYGEQEIVIKNLESDLVNTPGISGANILGDGTVSLILDTNKLLERAHK
ncbi:MAG: chemotaxis protein CheA [Candidatus Muiribacteriota bacterium]